MVMIVSISSVRPSTLSHNLTQAVHSVSLSVTSLANFSYVSKTSVTTSITLTLLFRSAALFGIAGDYWGRKWPMYVGISAFHRFREAHSNLPPGNLILNRGNQRVHYRWPLDWTSQTCNRNRLPLRRCFNPRLGSARSKAGLAAGSFFLQFMVHGTWGVVPIHLNELSLPQSRAAFPGIAYQIGNAISSPAAEIVTSLSERHTITYKGKRVEAFGPVMGIATAIIAVSLALWTATGKEQRGSYFEAANPAGYSEEPPVAGSSRLSDPEKQSSDEEYDSRKDRWGCLTSTQKA